MKKLSAQKQKLRRKFDYRVLRKLYGGECAVSTHLTAEEAQSGVNAVTDERKAGHAAHYRLHCRTPTLVGPGEYRAPVLIRIDASDVGYPFREPTAWVVEDSGVFPWSPHFHPGLPVCLGTVWPNDGQILIAHLVTHILRLLNWDEKLDPNYGGYNRDSVEWWNANLGRPLNPDLTYPSLPLDELYGKPVVRKAGGFRPAASQELENADTRTGGFRPIRRLEP